MDKPLERLLEKRKDRAIATILGVKEREIDALVGPELGKRLRKVILDQINGYHETVVEVVGSLSDEGSIINETYLDRLDEILQAVQAIPTGV